MDFLDIKGCCRLIGVHPSTIYRLIKKREWPKPIHVGGSSRWLRHEVETALTQMMDAR
jgi:predicted DNA-binding transcriptional regulator AlpA